MKSAPGSQRMGEARIAPKRVDTIQQTGGATLFYLVRVAERAISEVYNQSGIELRKRRKKRKDNGNE